MQRWAARRVSPRARTAHGIAGRTGGRRTSPARRRCGMVRPAGKGVRAVIPVEEALEIILSVAPRLPVDEIPLEVCPGRVLARDVTSDTDLPPFDRAAMDGFAVRWLDAKASPVTLALVGTVQAGQIPSRTLERGEAVGIMTGAPVPPGADTVVPVEQARSLGHDRVEILACPREGQHVARRGSEGLSGDRVLRAGIIIDPSAVAVLASVGCVKVPVGRRPRVGLLVSGDEIVDAAEAPPPGCIRDSNSPALDASIRRAGGVVVPLGRIRDRAFELERAASPGLEIDALLTSGGVSEGLFDLMEPALERAGVRFHFTKVAIKPGAP